MNDDKLIFDQIEKMRRKLLEFELTDKQLVDEFLSKSSKDYDPNFYDHTTDTIFIDKVLYDKLLEAGYKNTRLYNLIKFHPIGEPSVLYKQNQFIIYKGDLTFMN